MLLRPYRYKVDTVGRSCFGTLAQPLAPGLIPPFKTVSCNTACRGHVIDRTSNESDDELDSSFAINIKQRADPRYLSKVAKRLDVVWTVSSRKGRKPGQCACCGGTGRGPCSFCRGSGALTLGEHVFCSLHDGCKPCPVCKSKGAVKCEHCSGTGFRAAWMEDPVCSVDPTETA